MPETSRLTVCVVGCAVAVAAACAPVPNPASPSVVTSPAASPSFPARSETATIQWGIVMHGGAGSRTPPNWSAEQRAVRETSMTRALQTGHAILAAGGSSLDAVQAAIVVLEDDSLFNAGRGAVLTAEGRAELDAALMNGPDLRVGTVAGVTRTKNPIKLARAVMDRSEHVMMIGDGAEQFGRQVGIEFAEPGYFITAAAVRSLEAEKAAEQRRRDSAATSRAPQGATARDGGSYLGTVGAVALDRQGRLAAGTSTGGRSNKRYGRVGDVPIIGAGTYANPRCAVSATGHGEWFIRYTVARDICVGVERGMSVAAAADSILFGIFDPIPVDGGVIVLDGGGNLTMSFNSAVMPRGYVGPDGRPHVQLTQRVTR